ncbi:tail protein X [Cupriavidus sp. UGS-1]|uniref:tail protein X n=1 Tax=Cupriavidus sp. UGS-1 TaxID=2899826 RepID=UPI001E52476D|nr:tail protein X [Cupriavidus sp. UGS-1]MCD9124026.1 tail protein X [Cupriavidus sp. UGS-1]
MRVRARQGDTVDLLVFRHFGRTRGLVETVLEMNPGLADLGPILPIGTEVELPSAPADQPTKPLLQLFD